jgi:NitT/TauT family transport system permease protein
VTRPTFQLERALPVLSLALLVAIWWFAAWWADDTVRLPAPPAVLVRAIAEAQTGELFHHLGITLARVVASFVVAMAIGTAVGIALGRSRWLDRAFQGWVVFFLNLPALVTIVLAYLWIGLSEAALITAVAVNKIPNVIVIVREGARALDKELAEMAKVFALGPWRTLTSVFLPQLYPYLVSAGRSGLALIWKIVLVTELLGRSSGVGFQIGLYFQLFDVATILAYALAFIVVILAVEAFLVSPLERRATRWRR